MRQPDSSFDFTRNGLELGLDLLGEAWTNSSSERATACELPSALPELGLGEERALRALAPVALHGAQSLRAPSFFAHMDPPAPWVAWVATLWAAAYNQNLLHAETGPSARVIEDMVIRWIAPWFGMDGGHIVPGSSLANLTALWAAREVRGVDEVVASEGSHVSIAKAAHLLGLRYRAVPVLADGTLDTARLGQLDSAALVLTAGTTTVGAVDPMSSAPAAGWRHVDAAWAGPLRLTDAYHGLLDGIELADSVSISGHKWLFQPKESALVLFADHLSAHNAISFGAAYLARPNVGLLGSHGQAALGLAATLLTWGRAGLCRRLEICMTLAEELAALVDKDERLELWGRPATGIVVWRPVGVDVRRVKERMTEATVSLTRVDGELWFRSVAANPDADPGLVVEGVLSACDQ